MGEHGVHRLVCVSSSATDPHPGDQGGFILEKLVQLFFIRVVGRTMYQDQRRMEALVKTSGLDRTIVRPHGLFSAPRISDYRVAETHIPGRFTSRADLADCMLNQLTDDTYRRKVVAVATVTGLPSFYKFLWTEGIRKR